MAWQCAVGAGCYGCRQDPTANPSHRQARAHAARDRAREGHIVYRPNRRRDVADSHPSGGDVSGLIPEMSHALPDHVWRHIVDAIVAVRSGQ